MLWLKKAGTRTQGVGQSNGRKDQLQNQSKRKNSPLMTRILSRYRWLTSIFLVVMVDVCTFFAFHKTSSPSVIPEQDKVLHSLAFFVLFLVGHLALHLDFFPRAKKTFVLMGVNWIIWLTYGALLEFVQSFLTYRQAQLGDFFADVIGMIIGTLVILVSKPVRSGPGGS